MKRSLQLAAVAALALSLASCDALDKLLAVNLFATKFEVSASDIQGMSLFKLERQSNSSSFMRALAEDPALVDVVVAKMDEIISTSGSPSEIQKASAIAASVLIETTAAPQIINGLVAKFAGGEATLPSVPSEVVDFIESLLPAELYSNGELNKSAFEGMIDSLIRANSYYVSMGDSIGEDGVQGINIGETAQNAVVVAFIAGVKPDDPYSPAEVLYRALTGAPVTVDFDPPDTGVDAPLKHILDAAGLSLAF